MRKQMLAIVLVLMLGLCGCSDNEMPQTKEPTEETTGITKTAEVENTESFLSSESKQEDTSEVPENAENSESPAQTAEPEKTNPQTVKSNETPAVTAPPENKGDPAKETEREKTKEKPPTETKKPQEIPKSDEPPVPSVTEAPVQKTAYDFEFDMESIKADCIGIGQSKIPRYQWHDGKGIAIEKYGSYTKPDILLSWSKVEKRLRELIVKNKCYLNPKEEEHYPDYLEKENAPQYEIDSQRKIRRQVFIDSKRDLPPADKRDTLALRLSDFIRDLNGYEKDLLANVERTDISDITAEQMEQHLSDPATVQQLIDFLKLVQGKTSDVYSRSNAWRFGQELLELHPLHYLYHEGDAVYIGADKYEVLTISEDSVSLQNVEFPLFGKEFSRGDLEEKLKENSANDHLKVVVTEKQKTETLSEKKPDSLNFYIGFSEHPAFYDRELNDRFTNLSFALGNKLLGVLDEKQHRERGGDKNIGWYHKTDFEISAVIGGEDFHYDGRFDIGDGEGDLIAHIKNFYDYCLSPNCPFIPEWKKQGEDYYREQMESLRFGREHFIPYLEQHTELPPEDEKLLAEIMATESDWYRVPEEAEQSEDTPHYQALRRVLKNRGNAAPFSVEGYKNFLFLKNDGMPKVAANYESMLKGLVKKYNKQNKEQLPNITPHILSHTFCTQLANAGMNPKALQYIMGHANITMTLNYYAHATYDSAKAEMERLAA